MVTAASLELTPGRVYRTREFAPWSANPTRFAQRLVGKGALVPLTHGLFAHEKQGRFGPVPPTDEELMRAFLVGAPFVFTGPERWNALGLGSTAMFAMPLVYNTKRSGVFELGGRQFLLSRVGFPSDPLPEWFVVDLFEHAEQAGTSRSDLAVSLQRALSLGRFNSEHLQNMASEYGSKDTQGRIASALTAADVLLGFAD